MEKFHIYISKILELKEEINLRQKIEDVKLAEFMKHHQNQLQKSNISINQRYKVQTNKHVNASPYKVKTRGKNSSKNRPPKPSIRNTKE
jgi:hypothetical protein